MRERFAIVTYEVSATRGKRGLGFGYLVETPDGKSWCFPSPETADKFPGEIEAFQLNPARLKIQASDDDRRRFVYAADI